MICFRLIGLRIRRVKLLKREKWIAITAGLGSADFEGAAIRVKESLEKSGTVDKVVAVLTADLKEICPTTAKIYSPYLNQNVHGFGFWCWKAEIVIEALSGRWGDFDGVIWIDAGCEVSINPISLLRFNSYKHCARRNGLACFSLNTAEIEFTKRDLFELFPSIDPKNAGEQIQATWMFFHRKRGHKIAQEWFDLVCSGVNFLDFSPSALPEYPEFIQNRNDQSAFSMVCKANKVKVMKHKPTAGTGSYISVLRGFVNPIWTSRNRKSDSIKSRFHYSFEIQSSRVSKIHKVIK